MNTLIFSKQKKKDIMGNHQQGNTTFTIEDIENRTLRSRVRKYIL